MYGLKTSVLVVPPPPKPVSVFPAQNRMLPLGRLAAETGTKGRSMMALQDPSFDRGSVVMTRPVSFRVQASNSASSDWLYRATAERTMLAGVTKRTLALE